ncbi:biopolymer transporter ExbD [candidate division WOR-3 bacterium]|nr:biopolymer transporter ExbD [candidate division WOR-3 bacterium]
MKLREKATRIAEIPTVSMADIAFLLLIFFMVTTVFANEIGLQILLPEKGQEVKVKSENIQKVYVEEMGGIRLNGEPVDQDDFVNEIKAILSVNKDAIFSIKTHPKSKYQYMINAFDKLRLANAERVSLAPSTEE